MGRGSKEGRRLEKELAAAVAECASRSRCSAIREDLRHKSCSVGNDLRETDDRVQAMADNTSGGRKTDRIEAQSPDR